MSKYIDANELHNQGWVAARYINWEPTPLNDNFRLEVEVKPFITFPAADVAEIRHGEWVFKFYCGNMSGYDYGMTCSVCGKPTHRQFAEKMPPYCPNCGSRMDLDGDTE